jgi:hypothetical protein
MQDLPKFCLAYQIPSETAAIVASAQWLAFAQRLKINTKAG